MKKKGKIFNKYEKRILVTLYRERRPMNFRQISEDSEMSWSTVKKWVEKLEKKGVIIKHSVTSSSSESTRFKWVLNRELFLEIIKRKRKV